MKTSKEVAQDLKDLFEAIKAKRVPPKIGAKRAIALVKTLSLAEQDTFNNMLSTLLPTSTLLREAAEGDALDAGVAGNDQFKPNDTPSNSKDTITRPAPTFGKDDFLKCQPVIDPNLTYPEQLAQWRTYMIGRLADLN